MEGSVKGAFRLLKTWRIADICSELRFECPPHMKDAYVESVAPLHQAAKDALTFSNGPVVENSAGAAILAPSGPNVIAVSNPRLSFIKALAYLDSAVGFVRPSNPPAIDSTAIIAPTAVIEAGVTIGARTVIGPGAVIHSGTRIGKDCEIGANSVIGASGFGFERDEDGVPIRFVHLGGVTIGDHVEIGPLSSIARGSLQDTTIGDHAKIDTLVHVAHNCTIGKGAFLIGMSEIAGSVAIGDNAWIGPNASVMNKARIGAGARVGLATAVMKSVGDGETAFGVPARVVERAGAK